MTGKGNKQERSDTIVTNSSAPPLPRNIISAISQIQQYYTLEKKGSEIPTDFLTLEGTLDFWFIGFKTSLIDGIVVGIMGPIMLGVFRRYIPIFGTFEPNFFDRIWSLIMTFGLTIGYTIFLSSVTRYYIGQITKTAIKNLFSGIFLGAFLKALLLVIFYHTLYYLIITPRNVFTVLNSFEKVIGPKNIELTYYWIMSCRQVLPGASVVAIVSSIILILVPVYFMLTKARKVEKKLNNAEKWGFFNRN